MDNFSNLRTTDYRFNQTTFRVSYGDITEVKADVLVSSDDNYLSMGGGVSLGLLRTGGETIQHEAQKHIPLTIGDVAVTSAGKLNAKYIFHVVTIDFDHGNYANEETVSIAVKKCLSLCDSMNLRSIVFPALGTGVANFPVHLAAEVMTRNIAEYLDGSTALELVTITLFPRNHQMNSSLNLFYERAVALATLRSHSIRLNSTLGELLIMVKQMNNQSIIKKVEELQKALSKATDVLSEKSNDFENIEGKQERSEISELSLQAINISEQPSIITTWEYKQLEADVLRTKLRGLLTQQNIVISNLNQYEIKKAKYGIDVPIYIENAIHETNDELEKVEDKIRQTKLQLSSL